MATVRMLVRLSGSRDGADWPEAGDTLNVPAEEAAQLVGSRLAEIVAATPRATRAPVVETADVTPAAHIETANAAPVKRSGRAR